MQVYFFLIYVENVENVVVVGFGIIDGQGEKWWCFYRNKELKYLRFCFICFYKCNNVIIEGIKIINFLSWIVNFIECQNVIVYNVKI